MDLVARIMAVVPPWVRIYRIQRDIPMPLVTSGVEKGNLRELSLARMGQLGLKCRDVRTREAGIQDIHHQALPSPPPPPSRTPPAPGLAVSGVAILAAHSIVACLN